jgi:hypothetical protein
MFCRIRLLVLFLVALIVLVVPIAQAQTVEEDNVLVFYFDEDATTREWWGLGEVTAYLIAGPLVDFNGDPYASLSSWGCNELGVVPFANVDSAILTVRGTATPSVFELTSEISNVGVPFLEPMPLNGRVVLAELALNVISNERTDLAAFDASYEAEGQHRWFEIMTGGPHGPMDIVWATASINADAPVSTNTASWGSVKAIYR